MFSVYSYIVAVLFSEAGSKRDTFVGGDKAYCCVLVGVSPLLGPITALRASMLPGEG